MVSPKRYILGLLSLCLMIRGTGGNESCQASIRGACPRAWIQWGDKCYQKLGKKLLWAEAKQECIKMGSALVMPQSQEETDFLVENLANYFWIDCNDLEGTWVCHDGTAKVEYTNWGINQSSYGYREDCAFLNDIGVWNDVQCDITFPVICKRPAPQLHF